MSDPIDITTELRVHVARKYRRQNKAAESWGVSNSFVSMVLNGKVAPTQQMLDDAGFERVVSYRAKEIP